jgi:4-hydroxy-tetrahydrodipicolinate reductase
MNQIRVGIIGASGRMGLHNALSILENEKMIVAAGFDVPESAYFGKDIGISCGWKSNNVLISEIDNTGLKNIDVLVDFSSPNALDAYLELAISEKVPCIIGTTGYTDDQLQKIKSASKNIPIVFSGNYSTGINTLLGLVQQGIQALGKDFDIEIIEHHHNKKVDSPSGTAKMLGQAACEARGYDYNKAVITGREGQVGARSENEIAILALRGGGIIGKHSVYMVSNDETIELTHAAHNRKAFTSGVVKAVTWIPSKDPGYYDMMDVLHLK